MVCMPITEDLAEDEGKPRTQAATLGDVGLHSFPSDRIVIV